MLVSASNIGAFFKHLIDKFVVGRFVQRTSNYPFGGNNSQSGKFTPQIFDGGVPFALDIGLRRRVRQ